MSLALSAEWKLLVAEESGAPCSWAIEMKELVIQMLSALTEPLGRSGNSRFPPRSQDPSNSRGVRQRFAVRQGQPLLQYANKCLRRPRLPPSAQPCPTFHSTSPPSTLPSHSHLDTSPITPSAPTVGTLPRHRQISSAPPLLHH